MRAHVAPRGFTLIELLISVTISAVVIAGAMALMISQQRVFQTTSADRAMQETARVALDHITTNLRQAGFGVDPGLAFDFGRISNVRMDRIPANVTFSTTAFACGTAVSCRDKTTGPDEIVFLSRDPAFGPHPLLTSAQNSNQLNFYVGNNNPLRQGQIFQVVCFSGNMNWAYVQATADATPVNGAVTVSINSAGWTFPTQALSDACFSSVASAPGGVLDASTLTNATEVFKVDRYRYFIQSYDAAGAPQNWGTANTRPYLMLDQGLGPANTPSYDVIAPDVEDIQFAYLFTNDPTPANQLVGATPGTAITSDDNGINPAPATGCPVYSDPYNGPTRLNHHPGNIRAVKVSLVVRSALPDPGPLGGSQIPAAGNRTVVTGLPGYRRMLFETTIGVRNLDARAPYFPSYDLAGTTQLNAGGG